VLVQFRTSRIFTVVHSDFVIVKYEHLVDIVKQYTQQNAQICINIHPDTVPTIFAVSYHVATDKALPKMATSSGLFLATIYNQSQLVERKHVAHYWSINTAATAVPLSALPSLLVITTKLTAILGGRLFGGSVLPAQYCLCGRMSL